MQHLIESNAAGRPAILHAVNEQTAHLSLLCFSIYTAHVLLLPCTGMVAGVVVHIIFTALSCSMQGPQLWFSVKPCPAMLNPVLPCWTLSCCVAPCVEPCATAVRIIAGKLGWIQVNGDADSCCHSMAPCDDFDIYWTDTSVSMERVLRLNHTQVCCHKNEGWYSRTPKPIDPM